MSRGSRQAILGLMALGLVLAGIAAVSATANRRHGLRVDVLSARRAEPGRPVTVTISVRDSRGVATAVVVDFGDGSAPERTNRTGCLGAGQGASTENFDYRHRYVAPGVYTVAARVTSGCTGPRETVRAVRTIQVKQLRS